MRKNKKNKIISCIFILFTIFILITGSTSCSNKSTVAIETYKVQKGIIMQTVTSSGSVDASDKKNYTLQSSGEVLEVLATGSKFKKGDILVKVDNSKTQLLVSQAEENLKTAQNSIEIAKINYQNALDANHVAIQLTQSNAVQSEQATQNTLTSLENANSAADASINSARISAENSNSAANASINSAKVALEIAQDNYNSSPNSTNYNLLKTAYAAYDQAVTLAQNSTNSAQAAYEQAKANAQSQAESAEAAYKQALNSQSASYWNSLSSTETAQAQIKLTKKNIEQAEAQLTLSKISLEIAKLDLGKNVTTAPFDGIVLSSNYSQGEFASPGPAISIISNSFIVKADINETDITKIKIDQEVDITLDAYPDKHFPGKISDISPISKNTAGIITFEVTVKPDDSANSSLLYGISANLTITILKTENVLLVPIQAVYEENGKQYVDISSSKDNTAVQVEVTTGASDYDNIEIKSGLKEGDIIFTSRAQSATSSSSGGGLGIFRMGS
jgi:HlyD family secretion protein